MTAGSAPGAAPAVPAPDVASAPDVATEPADAREAAAAARPTAGQDAGASRLWPRRALVAAGIALTLEIALVIGFAIVYRPFDLEIYLWGGRAVTHGLRLYLVQTHGNWFTYPPFAAALFAPLGVLPSLVTRLAWEVASVGVFAWCCLVTLKLAGYRPSRTVLLGTVAAGLALEPVYHTFYLGQVNVFLLALVLGDIWLVARDRRAGIGVGVATAIKLVPGIFILLFLLTRRTRDAITAAATFAICTLTGAAIDPSASRLYWTRLFYDTTRVGATYISNQSAYAAVARLAGGVGHVDSHFYAVPLGFGAIGLAVARTLARRGDWLGAATSTGITGLVVSPISWTHHWVWVMPALVLLWRGGVGSRVTAGFGYLLFALAPMWWTPHAGLAGDYGSHGVITLIANSFLIAGVAFIIYLAVRTYWIRSSGPGSEPSGASPRFRDLGQAAGVPPVPYGWHAAGWLPAKEDLSMRAKMTNAAVMLLARLTPYFESELLGLASVVGPGSVCIDAGAAAGLYSLALSQLAGPSGAVHSIEPLSFAHPVWRRVLDSQGCPNVRYYNLALGTEAGPGVMSVPSGRYLHVTGRSFLAGKATGLGPNVEFTSHEEIPVEVDTLDALVERADLTRLDFIKIDTEGGELHVLQGGERAIKEFRPAILVEIEARHTARYEYTPEELVDWLVERGYRMYTWRHGWREASQVSLDRRNYLFRPDSPAASSAAS